MHEERLGGVADAGPVGLGVDRDRERLVEVGGPVDVDVAVADAGLDDGHGRLGDDGLDEVGAAARDEQVDQAAGGHQGADGAVAALEEADGVRGQALALERVAQHGDDGAVGVGGGAAAAQDDGVAGLQAEAGGVDGDVGAGLVDHADDAHRHAHLADLEAVGEGGAADDLADRVGQGGDVAQRLGHGGDARGVEAEAVLEAVRHARARGRGRGRARWPRRPRRWRRRGRRRGCAARRPSRRGTAGRAAARRCGPPRRARGPARRRRGRCRRCGQPCLQGYAAPRRVRGRPAHGHRGRRRDGGEGWRRWASREASGGRSQEASRPSEQTVQSPRSLRGCTTSVAGQQVDHHGASRHHPGDPDALTGSAVAAPTRGLHHHGDTLAPGRGWCGLARG